MRCQVAWHDSLSCTAFQALPAEERTSSADIQVQCQLQHHGYINDDSNHHHHQYHYNCNHSNNGTHNNYQEYAGLGNRCGASYINMAERLTFVFPDATILMCIHGATFNQRASAMSTETCMAGCMQECNEIKTCTDFHCLTSLPVLCSSLLTAWQSKQRIVTGHTYTAGLRLPS